MDKNQQKIDIKEKEIQESQKIDSPDVVYDDSSTKRRVKLEKIKLKEFFKSIDFSTFKFKNLVFFIIGFMFAIVFVFCFKEVLIKSSSVKVSDTSINLGINNVFDATVYIENKKTNKSLISGTGFVYKKDSGNGYILTNYHVVSDSKSLEVSFSNGKKALARYVGGDKYLDIAVISVDDIYVKQIAKFISSSSLQLGDTVFTVGSPVGSDYTGTVTRGILSGKNRFVSVSVGNASNDYVMKLIQTDAAMNPGNSGGPLCNINGEVIGINSLKLVKEEVEGIAFAIPIEDIRNHLDDFEAGKKISRPYLGITMFNLNNSEAMNYYGFNKKITTKRKNGVVVESVLSGTSADGRLEVGDIIVKLGKSSIKDMAYLRYELFKYKVGDKVKFVVERDGKLVDVLLKLQKK